MGFGGVEVEFGVTWIMGFEWGCWVDGVLDTGIGCHGGGLTGNGEEDR